MKDYVNCPACASKGCPARLSPFSESLVPSGPCASCGWCAHEIDTATDTSHCAKCGRLVNARRDWCELDHLPRGASMPEDEWRFRASLFVVWKTRPASELRQHFEVFADWLRERDSAEEHAARADWLPYANKKHDPKGWFQWSVPAGTGWVEMGNELSHRFESGLYVEEMVSYIDYDRARLTKSLHNGRWLLCWPPGFCRFTAPLSHDPQRWRVTILANRLNGSTPSRPVERVWPGGYTQLLMPFVVGNPKLVVESGVVREPKTEDLGLFAEDGA